MHAVGLARGNSHTIPPWPDQEAYEAKYWAANEALAIYFLAKCGTDDRRTFSGLRRTTTAISQLPDGATWKATTVFCEA